MTDPDSDPRILALRDQITTADRAMLVALNDRLALVREMRRYKAEQGYEFVDPDRERQLLADLEAANAGPLSNDGLRGIYAAILDLMKRETGG